MTGYADRMKEHLAQYKRERLGVAADGVWRSNNRPYGHILPESLRQLNILETTRREFWRYYDENRATLGLHTDFHHLNSSQAFAFNVLFPWMAEERSIGALLNAMGLPVQQIKSWQFEYMPDPYERTSVDFSIEFTGGSRLLMEVKLTEARFGQCVPRDVHVRKLEEVYTRRLAGKVPAESLGPETFFLNYQLFRNVSSLDLPRGDLLILMLPRANELTWKESEQFLERHVLAVVRERICVVAAEDLVTTLAGLISAHSPRLQTHLEMLWEKYFPES